MGKIKSKLIKKTAQRLSGRGIEFSEDFEENKKILGKSMPSKKIRNQIAGFLSRTEKQKKKEEELLKS
ncbi:MAG: 30S ribosomal protein S17e [Candidatus Pacearchaeota archaeon]